MYLDSRRRKALLKYIRLVARGSAELKKRDHDGTKHHWCLSYVRWVFFWSLEPDDDVCRFFGLVYEEAAEVKLSLGFMMFCGGGFFYFSEFGVGRIKYLVISTLMPKRRFSRPSKGCQLVHRGPSYL